MLGVSYVKDVLCLDVSWVYHSASLFVRPDVACTPQVVDIVVPHVRPVVGYLGLEGKVSSNTTVAFELSYLRVRCAVIHRLLDLALRQHLRKVGVTLYCFSRLGYLLSLGHSLQQSTPTHVRFVGNHL